MTPLGHRVLIRPDEQPSDTTSGILLPEDRDYVPSSGIVVALGPGGSKVRHDARQRAFADVIRALQQAGADRAIAAVTALKGTRDPVRDIRIGDRVAFDNESGLVVTENGVRYVILDEDDVVVIVDEAQEAVAV